MSFILISETVQPLVRLSGTSDLVPTPSGILGFKARLSGTSDLSASGSNAILGGTMLEGSSSLYAFGRIGDEPNVFGSSVIEGNSTLTATPAILRTGVAVLSGSSGLSASGRLSEADRSVLNVFLQIADLPAQSFGKTYSARLYADGLEIPISGFNFNAPRSSAGYDLQVTLVRISDRNLIESASEFKFDIYDDGAWKTIFETGKRTGDNFTLSFGNGRMNNSASISTSAPISEMLDKSPEKDFILFDSARLKLSETDFENVFDTDGNSYRPQLRAAPGLSLYRAMEIIFVEKCGFAGYRTNIPNFPIRRVDAEMTGSFLDSIGAHIGIFNPLFFVRENVLWVLDTSGNFPEGFAPDFPLTANLYRSAQFSSERNNADGFRVQFSQNETDFDYTIERVESLPTDQTGSFGEPDYTETTTTRTFRDFYKAANPLVPVKTEKLSEVIEVRNSEDLISRETENYIFDSFGRISQITKLTDGLIPDLENIGAKVFINTRRESSSFAYKPDPTDPKRQILALTVKQIRGLVAVDSENPYLGENFTQDFEKADRAGNLLDGMTSVFAPIETTTETAVIGSNNQIEVKVRTIDHLRNSVVNSTTDARSGDVSLNAQTSVSKEVIVLRPGAIRTNAKLQNLSVGELPLRIAIPLARRRLARPERTSGNIPLVGLRLNFRRGSTFEFFNQQNESFGNFIVEGFSIAGANLGTRNQQTSMNLEVIKI